MLLHVERLCKLRWSSSLKRYAMWKKWLSVFEIAISSGNPLQRRKTFIHSEFSVKFRVTLKEFHVASPKCQGKFGVLSVNFNGFPLKYWKYKVYFKEILRINQNILKGLGICLWVTLALEKTTDVEILLCFKFYFIQNLTQNSPKLREFDL